MKYAWIKKICSTFFAFSLIFGLLITSPGLKAEEENPILPDLSGYDMPVVRDGGSALARLEGQGNTGPALRELDTSAWNSRPVSGIPDEDAAAAGAALLPVQTEGEAAGFSLFSDGASAAVIGATKTIKNMDWAQNPAAFLVTLAGIGEHCLVWVRADDPKAGAFLPSGASPNPNAAAIIDEFDQVIYPLEVNGIGAPDGFTSFQGIGAPMYPMGTAGKVNLVLYDINGDGANGGAYVAGFFNSADYTSAGNGDAILYIDIGAEQGFAGFVSTNPARKISQYGILAHEFQHLINFSQNTKNYADGRLTSAPNDPDGIYRYATTTWLNEGLSGLMQTLYLGEKGYYMEFSHLSYFANNLFQPGVGYVPTRDEWDSAAGNSVLANYGASSALMQEFAALEPDRVSDLVSSPKAGYTYSKENVGSLFGSGFDNFFTVAMLNIFVDSSRNGNNDPPVLYTSALRMNSENMWAYLDSTPPGRMAAFNPDTPVTFDSGGRAYYEQTFLAGSVGASGAVKITVPENAAAAYYVVTPYDVTGIDARPVWDSCEKMAAQLNPGENTVTVGSDNMFAVIAIACETPACESVSYTIPESGPPSATTPPPGGGPAGSEDTPPPSSLPASGWQNPFGDVSAADWFCGDVQYVYENGLMLGTSVNAFSPKLSVTRAMIVTTLYRMAGCPDVAGISPFRDVDSVSGYCGKAVLWATRCGLAAGYEDGTFRPNDSVSRQEFAVFLARYIDLAGLTLPLLRPYTAFADEAGIYSYAADAVRLLYCGGVIGGKDGNCFDPLGTATRAEAAAMLHRLLCAAK